VTLSININWSYDCIGSHSEAIVQERIRTGHSETRRDEGIDHMAHHTSQELQSKGKRSNIKNTNSCKLLLVKAKLAMDGNIDFTVGENFLDRKCMA